MFSAGPNNMQNNYKISNLRYNLWKFTYYAVFGNKCVPLETLLVQSLDYLIQRTGEL